MGLLDSFRDGNDLNLRQLDNISDAVLLVCRCTWAERSITTRWDNSICISLNQFEAQRFYRSTGIVAGMSSFGVFLMLCLINFNFNLSFQQIKSPDFLMALETPSLISLVFPHPLFWSFCLLSENEHCNTCRVQCLNHKSWALKNVPERNQ